MIGLSYYKYVTKLVKKIKLNTTRILRMLVVFNIIFFTRFVTLTYFQNSKYTFSSFLDRSLARVRATGEKTTWIRGDDVLMSGKNLFSLFLMKNCAEEEFSVDSNTISIEIRSGK